MGHFHITVEPPVSNHQKCEDFVVPPLRESTNRGSLSKAFPDTSSFGRYPIVNKSLSYRLTGLVHTEKRDHIMRHVVAYKSSRSLMRGGRLREVLISLHSKRFPAV